VGRGGIRGTYMSFGVLTLVVVAGLAGPLLSALPRVGLPLVVGEVLAGIGLGPSGAGWLDPQEPTVAFLAEVGFAMLMFVVGTRLPLRDPALRNGLPRAALGAVLVLAAAIPAGLLLARLGPDRPFLLADLVATSSAAVALPLLPGLATSADPTTAPVPSVGFAVGWITLVDVLTVLAVPFVLSTGGLPTAVLGTVVVVAAALTAGVVLQRARETTVGRRMRSLSASRGWALDLRVGLATLFALATLATAFGTSILVAGFAAGALLAAAGEPRRLAQQLVGVAEGFLVPVFFVTLGARLQLRALVESRSALILCVALVLASAVIHLFVVLVLRQDVATGLLATASLGVPSAIASIGLTQGVLDPAHGAAVVTSILGTVLVSAAGGVLIERRERSTESPATG
jgi:Kef-type K+ transport system membrane component KefB